MPGGILYTEIQLTRGEIWIPTLSVLVARMERPRLLLRRREDTDLELGRFDLHAAVSYFNPHLWADVDYDKTITLWLGKRPLRVLMLEMTVTVITPGALRIEGVSAEWQHEE